MRRSFFLPGLEVLSTVRIYPYTDSLPLPCPGRTWLPFRFTNAPLQSSGLREVVWLVIIKPGTQNYVCMGHGSFWPLKDAGF